MRPPSILFREKARWLLLAGGVAALAFLGGYLVGNGTREAAHSEESSQAATSLPNRSTVEDPKVSRTGSGYQLAFESEEHWNALKTRIDGKIAQSIAAKGSLFEKTLRDLGVSQDEVENTMAHAWKVMRASIEVEAMQQQFLKAQSDYDKRLRRLLSTEQYAKYRFFEESKRFQFEYESFKKYALKQNLPDFSAFQSDIQNAIYEAQAYTMSFLHGPYDGMPNLGLGKRAAMERLQQDIARVSASSTQLVETQSARKLPSECIEALKSYYSACLDHMRARENKIEAELLQSTAKG